MCVVLIAVLSILSFPMVAWCGPPPPKKMKLHENKALKEGPEIVVATPGRMIEMLKLKVGY